MTGCITVNVGGPSMRGPLQETAVSGEGRDKVAVLDLSGAILSESVPGLLGLRRKGESFVDRVQAQLDKAAADRAVKAVVLRINSPGGGVTASDIVYQAVRQFKKEKKVPVVASFVTVAASGGYYVAMASDEIVAHPTTTTGSIGVILQNLNMAGLFEKVGLRAPTVKSGPLKDMGSPTRPPTPEETAVFQSLIQDMFERFLSVVQSGRPRLTPARIRELADGRIYSAQQALAAGLVDRIGDMTDAVGVAKRRAGLEEARVVLYYRPGEERPTHLYATAAAADAEAPPTATELLAALAAGATPEFLYLWPGL